jgi:arylsulfatase A-like enzyme
MNIVLISIDTLSARHMSAYGYRYPTSPNLTDYARQGVLCRQMYCPAIPTQPSYTTICTGQYSITHGVVTHGGKVLLLNSAPWLPRIIAEAGFTTCAVDNLGPLMKPWFFRGYEFYINPSLQTPSAHKVNCETINSRALPWLEQHARERFLMFVHYWEPHTPYLPPKQYRGMFYEGDPFDPNNTTLEPMKRQPWWDWWGYGANPGSWFRELSKQEFGGREITDAEYIRSLYDGEVRYVDDHIVQLLGALDRLGIADDTLVLITSDHGEMMYHHDIFFDHHGLYDPVINSPLIIRWPAGLPSGVQIEPLVEHVDLAPTILAAAGIPIPETMEGANLLPLLRGQDPPPPHDALYTQECTRQAKWAIRTDQYKFIIARVPDLHGTPMRELYDLRADPRELNNLAEQQPEVAAELEKRLEGWIEAMIAKHKLPGDPVRIQGPSLVKDWQEWSRQHGYW